MTGDDRPASYYDPYHVQRLEERRQAKLARVKEKLREEAGKGPSRAKAQREPQTSIAKVLSDRDRKNSRRKGNRGELDVAKAFSLWCGEHVRRTPLSGGWSSAKFGVTGDLVCDKEAFPFHVEIKHREGWTLDDLVTGARGEHDKSIVQWWKQCVESCPQIKGKNGYVVLHKEPLLVFRRNRQPWLVMMAVRHDDFGSLPNHFMVDGYDVTVLLLSEFLEKEPVPYGLKNHRRKP